MLKLSLSTKIIFNYSLKTFECDLCFFTSVAEGTPHVILEAIGNNLPVLCFNTCGQGDAVNKDIGMKIELTNPKQSAKEFAAQIDSLYENKKLLRRMKENASIRQQELSWESKSSEMLGLYDKIIQAPIKNI